MTNKIEAQYSAILDSFLRSMDNVEAPIYDYREALRWAIEEIEGRLETASSIPVK